MTAEPLLVAPVDDPLLGLAPALPDAIPAVSGWCEPGGADDGYGALLGSVRSLLDHLAAARPDESTTRAVTRDLDAVRDRLAEHAVAEADQVFAHRIDVAARGQTLVPPYVVQEADRDRVRATLVFGRYFLGANGAVHGGAISLLFENVFGELAISGGRTFGRAAYTHVNFRAVTPVGREVVVEAWFESEVGRKRVLRGEIRDGDVLCVEAEGLVVELRPGQP
ncbi:MAG: thioesterase family protein [Marmoricola sp.]|nr:thioesterase family protein [Marmoricola sp.]